MALRLLPAAPRPCAQLLYAEHDWLDTDIDPDFKEEWTARIASISVGSEVKVGLVGKTSPRFYPEERNLWFFVEVDHVVDDDSAAGGRRVFGTVASDFEGDDVVPVARCKLGDRVTIPVVNVLTVVDEEHPDPLSALIESAGLRGRIFMCGGLSSLLPQSSRVERAEMKQGLTVKAITALLDSTGSRDHRKFLKNGKKRNKSQLLDMIERHLALEAKELRDRAPAAAAAAAAAVAATAAAETALPSSTSGDHVTFPAAKVFTTVGSEHKEPTAAIVAAAGLRGCVFQAGGLRTLRQRSSRIERDEMEQGLTVKAINALLDTTGSHDHRKRRKYEKRPTKSALLDMLEHQLALEAKELRDREAAAREAEAASPSSAAE